MKYDPMQPIIDALQTYSLIRLVLDSTLRKATYTEWDVRVGSARLRDAVYARTERDA